MSRNHSVPLRHPHNTGTPSPNRRSLRHLMAMVSALILALALVVPDASSGARVEARAKATIQRGITVQNGKTAARPSDIAPIAQRPRTCATTDQPTGQCQLIVYDLP